MKLSFIKIMFPLYEAPDNLSGGVGSGAKDGPGSADDDLKTLREGEPEPEPELEEEPEVEAELEQEEETNEDEDQEDEPEVEEQEDEDEPVGALVTAKDLKAKLGADVFKKVPELKGVIYREQQYSQIFADPKEAQQASTMAKSFVDMSNDLTQGKAEPLLNAIKDADKEGYTKFAANFIPALEKLDEPLLMKVLAVPFKRMLRSALAQGTKKGDNNLALSAQHIHNFIFENTNLDEKAELESEPKEASAAEREYKDKIKALDERDYKNSKSEIDNSWLEGLNRSFLDGLDPDGTMSKWMKDKLFETVIIEVNRQLTADPRHMKNMELLWKAAKASGYNSESKSRIVNTALARAKQILPQVRMNAKKEALAKERRSEQRPGEERKPKIVARSSGERKPEQKKNPKNTSTMSDLDIIRS